MAANKILNLQGFALAAAAANVLNCNVTSLAGPVGVTVGQPYMILKHIRATNNDAAAAHTVKCFKGATGGSAVGTEFAFSGISIPATQYLDWYGVARFDSTDFLTGFADVANKITLNIEGEIGISG